MKNLSFAVGSAYTALLAFIIVCIDQVLRNYVPLGPANGFTYIAFIAWAVYFFSGCTWQGGIRAAIGYVIGISFSIGIIKLAEFLGEKGVGFVTVPLAVFIVVFFVLYLEKAKPWFDLIPAMFVASGCFFGIMNYVPKATLLEAAGLELIYGFIGLLFGWITITGKSILAKAFKQ